MNRTVWAALAITVTLQVSGQELDDRTRQVIAEEFLDARPVAPSETPKHAVPVSRHSKARPTASSHVSQLGVTLWLLRPARPADSGVRMLVHEDGQDSEWVPERVSTATPLRQGNRVRLSFESARAGYLYVVDQEAYGKDRLGDPYLIFPTTRIRHGDQYVLPGRLVEIPGQEDRPNFLTVRNSQPDQAGEVLTVVVTPERLPDFPIGAQPLRLRREQLAAWQTNWGSRTETVELASSAGKPWTRAEQQAGADETRLLTQDDPRPQTIYSVRTAQEKPLFVQLQLQYAANGKR